MKICLGVIDQPYDYGDRSATTHEVAEALEDEYGLFTHFWEEHADEICTEVGEAVALALVNHIQHGGPMVNDGELLGETMHQFNIFLEMREMEGLGIDGVPTNAALIGIKSRFKNRLEPGRESFIDGGLLKSSFVAWVGDDAES